MLLIALLFAPSGVSLAAPTATVSSADDTQVLPTASKVAPRAAESPAADLPRVPPPVQGPFDTQPFSFELRLGIATPTGGIGVAAEYSVTPAFAFGAGIGNNIYGAEPAAWLRLRSIGGGKRDRAFTGSLGMSSAPFEQGQASQYGVFGLFPGVLSAGSHNESPNSRVYERAYWVNTDIGLEKRTNAFVFRYFVGLAGLMNPSDGVEHRSSATYEVRAGDPVVAMVYTGFGFGFSL